MSSDVRIKNIQLDRSQTRWAEFDLEALIDEQHPARTIWELSEKFDLKRFEEGVKTIEGEAGRPCWPARLLVSVWVYSYTLGVASARAIERMIGYEPGLRWLTGDQAVNHHTLADFRVGHQEALKELFAQFLTLLDSTGVVNLQTIAHDGTKVKTVAGKWSFHGRKGMEKRLRAARQVVGKLDRQAGEGEGQDERRRAARQRVVREGLERAKKALEKLKQLETAARGKDKETQRVSLSEPEARIMKHPDGGWAPSYNVQVSTELQSRMIVGIGVTTAANDTQELLPALEQVKENCGRLPQQVLADNGYVSRDNVEASRKQNVALIAPWKEHKSREAGACARNGIAREFGPSAFTKQRGGKRLSCPAGKTLAVLEQKMHHGMWNEVFVAEEKDCRRCQHQQPCCGNAGAPRKIWSPVESEAMKEYLARMKQREVQQLYQKRSEVGEFPNLWMKAAKGWRRFSVRGLAKARMEAMWMALAYNIAQWMRCRTTREAAA